MNSEVIRFSRQEAQPLALEHLLRAGVKRGGEKKRARVREQAVTAHALVENRVDLRALVREIPEPVFEGDALCLDGLRLRAGFFASLETGMVPTAYLFAACAGEFELDCDPISDVYADLWGSSYVGALEDLLLEELRSRRPAVSEGFRLTAPFGPGFFGMELTEIRTMFSLLPVERIGLSLREYLMVPLKSYAGLVFWLREDVPFQCRDCASCIGNVSGCSYCRNFQA